MCCEKCTAGGISTPYGQKIFESTPPDERWRLKCPKMSKYNYSYGKDRVMWGICRASSDLERVECCNKCDFFS